MLNIEMLPAGHGDALVIEYGTREDVRRVLVDAGTIHSWPHVRERLAAMPDEQFEAFVVTHVDEDHIGGAVELLNDRSLRHRVPHVWFNGYVHSDRGGDVLGPIDGERLTLAIRNGAHEWNAPFPDPITRGVGGPVVVSSQDDLPAYCLPGDATIHLLSPTGPKLARMAKTWAKVVKEAGIAPGAGADLESRAPKPWRKEVDPLPPTISRRKLQELCKEGKTDGSAANGSSIAFIFEHGKRRVLLAADAHPGVLVSGLKRYAASVGEKRVRLDACKLPHHGSKANVTAALIESMDVANYLFSTNGDTFGHPDDAALARVLHGSSRTPVLHFNYASDRTLSWKTRAESLGATTVYPARGRKGLRVKL